MFHWLYGQMSYWLPALLGKHSHVTSSETTFLKLRIHIQLSDLYIYFIVIIYLSTTYTKLYGIANPLYGVTDLDRLLTDRGVVVPLWKEGRLSTQSFTSIFADTNN